jgi:hypothetical protein
LKIHYEKQVIEKHIKDVSVVSLKLMFTAVIKSRSSTQIYINANFFFFYLEMEGENSGNTREEKGGAGTKKKAHNRDDT